MIDDSALAVAFGRGPAKAQRAARGELGRAGRLEATVYETETTYDALNRVVTVLQPQPVTGVRLLLRAAYDRGGALSSLKLDNAVLVERVVYNARGQRLLIAFGNKVMCRYAYDARTFRLAWLRGERYTRTGLTYQRQGDALQELFYTHDIGGTSSRFAIRPRARGSARSRTHSTGCSPITRCTGSRRRPAASTTSRRRRRRGRIRSSPSIRRRRGPTKRRTRTTPLAT